MKSQNLSFNHPFKVVLENANAQAAVMTIAPGSSSGGESVHKADQWLFVLSGSGEAEVEGKRHAVTQHSLIIIEAGERHEIYNTGSEPLETLNFYTPPEF
jgi:mannose-6-phosphate isomerase-like protein (cupin superfamily)